MLSLKSLTPYVLKVEKNRDGKTGVISRGDRGEAIYQHDEDRRLFLQFLGEVCERTGWLVHEGGGRCPIIPKLVLNTLAMRKEERGK
jgi:hypothetical protein